MTTQQTPKLYSRRPAAPYDNSVFGTLAFLGHRTPMHSSMYGLEKVLAEKDESPGQFIPPKASSQVLQAFNIIFGVFFWRGTWGFNSIWFGNGPASAICSIVYGSLVIYLARSVGFINNLLFSPIDIGVRSNVMLQLLRQMLLLVLISGTSLFWRGVWILVDNFLPHDSISLLFLSLCIGSVGILIANNVKGIKSILIRDEIALFGG